MSPVDALARPVHWSERTGRSSARLDLFWIRGTVPHVLASEYSRRAEGERERHSQPRPSLLFTRGGIADLLSMEHGLQ
jgi:hypothetical protein